MRIKEKVYTLLRGTIEKRPTKLTRKRNPVIHPRESVFTLIGVFPESACDAVNGLIPSR